MSDDKKFKDKIKDLETELAARDAELLQYRSMVKKTNEQLETLISDLGQELKLAARIQKLLSPTEIPNIPGVDFSTKFNPGMKSGGDYFDIFEHDDRLKFGVILSSASGYSMSALFLSVLIKLSAQIEAKKGLDPDKVLIRMAEEMMTDVQPKDSASLFYGVVDRRTYELKFSLMGSLCGLIQVHGQDHAVWLEPSAPRLTKDFSGKPLSQTVTLGARDRLILCTEGITEAQNAQGEAFGRERLMKSVSRAPRSGVHELRNEILFQVEKFTGKSEPSRDQTVLVTEVKDKVIRLAKKSPV